VSLIKIISPYDFDWPDEQIVTPVHGYGSSLNKQAAMDVSSIVFEKDIVKVHVIALGAGEYWGSNRNGDFFPEESLIKHHDTFQTHGNFHKNHKNKPHDPKYGWVEKSWYNPKMHRVELVVAVDLLKYPEFESKIKNGDEIPVSMAAKLPYDLCSICGHRRTKPGREHTCKHINDELTKVYPDGRQVYALNLEPKFFDISEVWKPADRTAYVLRKVASAKTGTRYPIRKISNYIEPKLQKIAWDKIAFINKLSELEKRVEGELTGSVKDGKIETISRGVTSLNLPDEVLSSLSELPKATAYASLADKGVVLRPEEYLKMNNLDNKVSLPSISSLVRGIFSKMKDREDLSENCPERDFDLDSVQDCSKVSRVFSPYIGARSVLRSPVVKRITVIVLGGMAKPSLDAREEPELLDLEKESNFNRAVALSYGLYKASAIKYITERNQESILDSSNVPAVAAILENYV